MLQQLYRPCISFACERARQLQQLPLLQLLICLGACCGDSTIEVVVT